MSRKPNSVQRDTYIRANYNKKKIKQPDFPAEAPESNSYKHEAGNAEHSLHDLSSESSKEYSLTEFNESCDRAKNYVAPSKRKDIARPRYSQDTVILWWLLAETASLVPKTGNSHQQLVNTFCYRVRI